LLDYETVERKIRGIKQETVIRYLNYWCEIQPISLIDRWRRWLFAALSIRARWQANRAAYLQLAAGGWQTKQELRTQLEQTRIGLPGIRTDTVWTLYRCLDLMPQVFAMPPALDWQRWRSRLADTIIGMGMAKTSFALELCFPATCQVVCLDTHIRQLYGLEPSDGLPKRKYRELEKHWVETCRSMSYSPVLVRHILWDEKQGKTDTRYWSDVFAPGSVAV